MSTMPNSRPIYYKVIDLLCEPYDHYIPREVRYDLFRILYIQFNFFYLGLTHYFLEFMKVCVPTITTRNGDFFEITTALVSPMNKCLTFLLSFVNAAQSCVGVSVFVWTGVLFWSILFSFAFHSPLSWNSPFSLSFFFPLQTTRESKRRAGRELNCDRPSLQDDRGVSFESVLSPR